MLWSEEIFLADASLFGSAVLSPSRSGPSSATKRAVTSWCTALVCVCVCVGSCGWVCRRCCDRACRILLHCSTDHGIVATTPSGRPTGPTAHWYIRINTRISHYRISIDPGWTCPPQKEEQCFTILNLCRRHSLVLAWCVLYVPSDCLGLYATAIWQKGSHPQSVHGTANATTTIQANQFRSHVDDTDQTKYAENRHNVDSSRSAGSGSQ